MGQAHGDEALPAASRPGNRADGSVDVIRASHILEHFPAQVPAVLKHWAAKLKPGGVLKIAVPDFAWIAQAYLDRRRARRSRAMSWAARLTPMISTRRCSTSARWPSISATPA
jgi:2-polyprenyl-3-methyl-5-hydroxy-6-metoxy-1,4-benzoquinol methylase